MVISFGCDLNLSNLFRDLLAFAQYENSNKYKIFREVHHRSTGAQKTQESSRHSQAPMASLLRPNSECSVQPQPQCHQAIQPFRHQGISLKSVKRYFSVKTNLVICTCKTVRKIKYQCVKKSNGIPYLNLYILSREHLWCHN